MKRTRHNDAYRRLWAIVTVCFVLISSFSFSIPQAGAQSQASSGMDPRSLGQLIQTVYQFILRNYVEEPDAKRLFEGAMKGMFDALGDPHSLYMDADMMSDLNQVMEGTYAGIGLYISRQAPDDEGSPRYIEVVSPIEDTPAWKAGFKPGDIILAIDGETTEGLTTDQASRRIRGPEGTQVTLTIRRGRSAQFDVTATRAIIELPAVKYENISFKGKTFSYLRILDWTPQTKDRVREALSALETNTPAGLIVDLRSNPGGMLSSVIEVSDLFLASGTIVSTRGRSQTEGTVYTAQPDLSYPLDKPMVVLIDKGSASASEIFAGAMKDQRRALLVGEKSYGKGSVQQVYPIADAGFKLTMARYYTPSGGNIDKTGIPPDRTLTEPPLTEEQLATFEKLYESGLIPGFAKKHPEANRAEQDAFADSLSAGQYRLPAQMVRRMVRDEYAKTSTAPIYDLEFDSTLAGALSIIDDPAFSSWIQQSRTVKDLAEALRAEMAASRSAAEIPAGPANVKDKKPGQEDIPR